MTRFDWDYNGIWDVRTESAEYIGSYFQICYLLNSFAEENEELKRERDYWEKSSSFWKKRGEELENMPLGLEYDGLKAENEELKVENEQLKQQIVNIVENGLKELFGDKYRIIEDL